jgi:hypothetical protein
MVVESIVTTFNVIHFQPIASLRLICGPLIFCASYVMSVCCGKDVVGDVGVTVKFMV